MGTTNRTETWYESLHTVLKALNATLHNHLLCRPGQGPGSGPGPDSQAEGPRAGLPGRDDNSYMYILFVMFLFAVTVGSLILGYTRSRKVDKRSDPYHVYIKNRVSMIWCEVRGKVETCDIWGFSSHASKIQLLTTWGLSVSSRATKNCYWDPSWCWWREADMPGRRDKTFPSKDRCYKQ